MKQYPSIAFQSTKVEHLGGQIYKVTGNLTMHGVTKPITFDVAYRGQSTMMGGRTSLTARAKINRNDFGLGRSKAVQIAASSMATIEIDLQAVQTSMEVQEAQATAE